MERIPQYLIIPTTIFNKKNGVFLGEFEVFIRFNLENNKKTFLIGTQNQIERVRSYLQECMLGPQNIQKDELQKEFHSAYDESALPNF